MQINSRHLRQIIREELMLLTEQSVLSGYKQPEPRAGGTQVYIETQSPPPPPGTTSPATAKRSGTSKKLGVRVVKEGPFNTQLSYTFDVSALTIDSWTPDVPEGQPFMTVSFTVSGKRKTGIKLKNKTALKKIADAILGGTKAEGELVPFEEFSAALIVNY